MDQKQTRVALVVIVFTVFLDLLGLTLAIPVFTPLCLDQTGGILSPGTSMPIRTIILGLLLGIYPLFQFFSSPILGVLSDRHGRKTVLSYSILGMFAGYILMAVGIRIGSLALALLSRMIMGGLSGNLSVNQSAISDISDEKSRPGNFGLIGAAFGASFFIGPALGGFLSDPKIVSWFNYDIPFWLASILTLVNFIQVSLQFPETLPVEKRKLRDFHPLTGPVNIIKAFQDPVHRNLFLVVFFLGFGFNFFTQFFQVYLIDRFSITRSQIGILFSFIGISSILVQAFVIRPVTRRFRPSQILSFTFILLAAVFPLILLMPSFVLIFPVVFLVPLFNGLSNPNLTAVISGLGSEHSQGEILGVNQSIQAAAQFIPPLIGGFIVGYNTTLPIWITSAMILIAWLLFIWCRKKQCIY